MAVTIYDVAERLHVSVATVNRALRGTGRISPATKELVCRTASEMGYSPNRAAQALRRNPLTVGVLLCCPADEYLDEIMRGVLAGFEALAPMHVHPDLRVIRGANAEAKREEVERILQEFSEQKAAGAIVFLSGDCRVFQKSLEALSRQMPLASVGNDPGPGCLFSVSADGECAGRLAAELLCLCQRKKRTAVVTGSRQTDIHAACLRGFAAFGQSHGLTNFDVYEHEDDPARFQTCLEEICARGGYDGVYVTSSVTFPSAAAAERVRQMGALIVATDLTAANRTLLRREEISAVIFQDPFWQGKTVVKRLYDRLAEGGETRSCRLTPSLVFSSDCDRYETKEEKETGKA